MPIPSLLVEVMRATSATVPATMFRTTKSAASAAAVIEVETATSFTCSVTTPRRPVSAERVRLPPIPTAGTPDVVWVRVTTFDTPALLASFTTNVGTELVNSLI